MALFLHSKDALTHAECSFCEDSFSIRKNTTLNEFLFSQAVQRHWTKVTSVLPTRKVCARPQKLIYVLQEDKKMSAQKMCIKISTRQDICSSVGIVYDLPQCLAVCGQ